MVIAGPEHIAISGSLAASNAMQVLVIGSVSLVPMTLLTSAGKLSSFVEPFPRVVGRVRSIISARRRWLHAVNSDARRGRRARRRAPRRACSRRFERLSRSVKRSLIDPG